MTVALAQRRSVAGRFVLFSRNEISGPTDANGRFRIADLLPGDYYVRAPGGEFKLNERDASPTPADPSLAFTTDMLPRNRPRAEQQRFALKPDGTPTTSSFSC